MPTPMTFGVKSPSARLPGARCPLAFRRGLLCSPAVRSARIVLAADTHLGFDLPAHARTERRRRGDDFFANYRRVLAHVEATQPAAFVHGGDFFFRSRVAPAVVDEAFGLLAAVAERVPVIIVPGNHDRSRLPPSLWLGHRNIHVFDRPKTITIEADGVRLAFGGFSFAWGDLRAAFAGLVAQTGIESAPADARFLCLHHTVAGATVGPNGYTFRSGPDVISRRQLPASLTAVLSGHIHRAQVLEGPHPPVVYPGSTERTSFAERNEAKGFSDLEVAVPGDGAASLAERHFLELPARPMADLELPPELEAEGVAAFLAARAAALPGDAVVRIVAREPRPEVVEHLRAPALRAAFPPAMNVQLSREIIDALA